MLRFRHAFLGLGGFLTVLVLFLSDPDVGLVQNLPFGAGAFAVLINLVIAILYVGLLHLSRRALVDYIDLEVYFKKALLTPEGAGKALIAIAVMMLSIALVILAATK